MAYKQGSTTIINPSTSMQISDDFIVGDDRSILRWNSSSGGTGTIAVGSDGVVAGHPGVMVFSVSSGSSNATNFLYASGPCVILGGGVITFNYVMKLVQLSSASNRTISAFGLSSNNAYDFTPNNGVFFKYVDNVNSGRWQICTAAASSTTATDSGIAADTNWHRYTAVINAGATSIQYYIDGVSVGTVTTNIPTAAITPYMNFINTGTYTSGTQKMYADLFEIDQVFTTPR